MAILLSDKIDFKWKKKVTRDKEAFYNNERIYPEDK